MIQFFAKRVKWHIMNINELNFRAHPLIAPQSHTSSYASEERGFSNSSMLWLVMMHKTNTCTDWFKGKTFSAEPAGSEMVEDKSFLTTLVWSTGPWCRYARRHFAICMQSAKEGREPGRKKINPVSYWLLIFEANIQLDHMPFLRN